MPAPNAEELDYQRFTHEVRRRTGLDLGGYKPQQMQRRLRGLLRRSRLTHFDDYLDVLERDPGKVLELRRFVTINVSEFFRSPGQFERLRRTVLPRLLAERSPLRVWSAGCSYGAEPYSLVLLLEELQPGAEHLVLATDVDDEMLARAEAADSFTEQDLRNVPDATRERYFEPGPRGRFAIAAPLRPRVTFRRHDLLADPFEGDFDLIVCRNVMIFFTSDAKERLSTALYRALRPGGYLFVGAMDGLGQLPRAGFHCEGVGFYRK